MSWNDWAAYPIEIYYLIKTDNDSPNCLNFKIKIVIYCLRKQEFPVPLLKYGKTLYAVFFKELLIYKIQKKNMW